MRISGFLNTDYEPPAPFIKVMFTSDKLNIRKFLDLHIDTGASSTIILDKDAKYLGLKIENLDRAQKNIGGVGGLIDTYLIEDAIITFKTQEDVPHQEKLTVLVATHKLDKLTEEERALIRKMPSLLGRNILRKLG